MGAIDVGIASASLVIALVALVAAVMQLTVQVDIDARRKGKTDRLALGDWAIQWPQAKLLICIILTPFRIKSPWGDPRILTVPFITVGEIEKYLRAESTATGRGTLTRRMQSRLVESATNAIITGDGRYTGRMYAVRGTTRKRSEACWADAMDMCGMTRDHWSLLTGVSAQACDGAVRPANAVTNLHSLWGFGRVMGLRQIDLSGSRITMTNGGATLYLDTYAGVDRPTRLAHFSGSPNGRYMIVEEMSQRTAQSVYADAVWATGNVPDPLRLNPKTSCSTASRTRLGLPVDFLGLKTVPICAGDIWNDELEAWAKEFVADLKKNHTPENGVVGLLDVVHSPIVVSCIRTYPRRNLSQAQITACYRALLWCLQHWRLSRYQNLALRYCHPDVDRPRLPTLGTTCIGPEFITGCEQAGEWCAEVTKSLNTTTSLVDRQVWEHIISFAEQKVQDVTSLVVLTEAQRTTMVKILQCWKLMLLDERKLIIASQYRQKNDTDRQLDSSTATLATVTMASIAVATDSTAIGDDEVNKAMEIELGSRSDETHLKRSLFRV